MAAKNLIPDDPQNVRPDPITADYYEERELARILKKSPRTLARWNHAQIGPPRIEIGKLRLYKKSSVLEWLDGKERKRRKGSH